MGSAEIFTAMLLAALSTQPSFELCSNAMDHGCVINSLLGFVCLATAKCMLIVRFVSILLTRFITANRLCVFTSKRTGPFGDSPVFGRYANCPFIVMLFNWPG